MRLALAFVALVALASACDDEVIPPRVPTKSTQKQASPAERRDAACKATRLPSAVAQKASDGSVDVPQGNVARVDIEGAPDDGAARKAIGLAAGDALTVQKTQDALRHLYELGDIEDVRMEAQPSPQGVVLRFVIARRASLGEVVIHAGVVLDAPELENAFHAKGGAAYNPQALVSSRGTLVEGLKARGYADATLTVTGERSGDGSVDLCINLHEGSKITIDTIGFRGLSKIKEDELRPFLDIDHGKINAAGGVLDQSKIDDAIAKMAEIFDARGLENATISLKTARSGDKVSIIFDVEEGPVIILRRYEVKGDLVTDAGAYKKLLSLKSKDPFSRAKLVADIQKVNELHDKKGRKDLEVRPDTQVDPKNNTVDVVLVVIDPKKIKPPPPPPAQKK